MKIALITRDESDLSRILSNLAEVTLIPAKQADEADYEPFDALCILGGTREEPLELGAIARGKIEKRRLAGVRIFAEFVISIGEDYGEIVRNTSFQRLVSTGNVPDLKAGALLDDQDNRFCVPYFAAGGTPLLYYVGYVAAHDTCKPEPAPNDQTWGLWLASENLLRCSFCLANFNQARFAPRSEWLTVVSYVLFWLTGKVWDRKIAPVAVCRGTEAPPEEIIGQGIGWFENADLLLEDGRKGVCEGYAHHVDIVGRQKKRTIVRADCCGETAGAFRFVARLTGNAGRAAVADRLSDFLFAYLQEKEGLNKGMIRWSSVGYSTCYQDDVARAILPALLDMTLGGDKRHLADITMALDYLLLTTGTDGLRVKRTDTGALTAAAMVELRGKPGDFPSAHHNSYYQACLLLAYRLTGREDYRETAVRGLTTLMKVYPHTKREQSETQELCRLILPLACLYEATGEPEHLAWLTRVTDDLEKYALDNGGYREWDGDYSAACSRTAGGESSLLAENGDPVCDLLYSVNWLPLGFAHAYAVTGNDRYRRLFEKIAGFMARAQLVSGDPKLNGGWTRAYDFERNEPYGVPHDAGWGPLCMETGWTNAEIVMGLAYGAWLMRK